MSLIWAPVSQERVQLTWNPQGQHGSAPLIQLQISSTQCISLSKKDLPRLPMAPALAQSSPCHQGWSPPELRALRVGAAVATRGWRLVEEGTAEMGHESPCSSYSDLKLFVGRSLLFALIFVHYPSFGLLESPDVKRGSWDSAKEPIQMCYYSECSPAPRG